MTRTPAPRPVPIASALGTSQLIAAVAALVITGAVLIAYQLLDMRHALTEGARVQAAIVADSVTAPLMFGDREAARDVLRAFRYAPGLRAIGVYDQHGQLFAEFSYPDSQLPARQPDAGDSPDDVVTVTETVRHRNTVLGQTVLRTGTSQLRTAMLRYLGLLAVASLLAMLVVTVLSRKTRARVAAAERKLEYMAHTDHVTGLPNRHSTYARLAVDLERARAQGQQLALLLVDLDNFKVVNDTAGHAAGDELLTQVAAALLGAVRATDLLGRIGGDEFAIIAWPVADRAAALAMASQVTQALRRPFQLESGEFFATASVGLCLYPDDAHSMSELVSSADTALYHAKHGGRNRLAEFVPAMTVAAQRRAALERELRHAVDQQQLTLHYQPQFDCTSGALVGVETLLRWNHPEHGLVSPAEFIPIAEDSGLIVQLGSWVLHRACHEVMAWDQAGAPPLTLAVNMSARQLREPGFIDDVMRALALSGLPPERLELELTESVLMEDVAGAVAFMQAVRALGVGLSIDDFGTGYSSLAYLQSFPINQLKVDRSFVQLLPHSGETVIHAILALAHGFGLTVVAEGVEDQAQLDWLRAAGCEMAQGFLLGRPMPPQDFAARYLALPAAG
ncbi:diguanylate cyclase (GGDEF) domain-containing protein [Duganella sp. CF402]|uniref:putative bifunctional diguanylate cyclase/phosphodiesterase n=1 Tax=unclassified Duganella TaxID=2636909 RepID=UPI0008C2A6B9|nr:MULTISPECIES: GGDEF and EAL domain-containing protein [unclassified Duganella]RZT05612.1 diguanylate cyclase/phosphodiesterase [Duganella sp. BK701]SEM97471.1 diguanylate cyclase (GGDEF) domain-containing protein [Duganella sp. CF402]